MNFTNLIVDNGVDTPESGTIIQQENTSRAMGTVVSMFVSLVITH